MTTSKWLAAVATVLCLVGVRVSQGADKPQAPLQTLVLGGVEASGVELAAMQKGSYLLHARDGKLRKVPAQKYRLPHDPKGHIQIVHTALTGDGVVYVNQASIMCKSTDGGKTWTSYPRQWGEAGGWGPFRILRDGTFITVWTGEGGKGPSALAKVMVSSDEGRTWKERARFRVEVPDLVFIGAGMPIHRLADDTLLWFGRWDRAADIGNAIHKRGDWYSMTYMCRSKDGGKTWSPLTEFHEHVFEGAIAQLPSGRLLAPVRYQRLGRKGDPAAEQLRGGSPVFVAKMPYKHLFLLESTDHGRTWINFRQLTTAYGQNYGHPVVLNDGTVVVVRNNGYNPNRSGLAMISYDEGKTWEDEAYYMYAPGVAGDIGNAGYAQSMVLEGGEILTIAGTSDHGNRRSWHSSVGKSDLTAIRWKPLEKKTQPKKTQPKKAEPSRFQLITQTDRITDAARKSLRDAIPLADSDSTRPVYHFRPPAQWMNDPTGAIYHEGYYHLFYQFGPTSDRITPSEMYWAHARSKDLVHWEDLPVALWASKELGERRCNSGSIAVNGRGRPMIFYTSCPLKAGLPRQQWAALAEGADLIKWRKHPANPLLSLETHGGPKFGGGWGDTVIFQANDRTFMIIGAELGDEVVLPIYETERDDWAQWKYRGLLYRSAKSSLKDIETPSFFPIGDQWVFVCSPSGPVQYFIGSFDLEKLKFQPVRRGTLDHSYGPKWSNFLERGFYANHTFIDEKGRTVVLGWVSGFKLGRGWNGCLALPRIFSLGADGLPRQQPVPGLQRLRQQHFRWKEITLENEGQVVGANGDTLEILASIEPGTADSVGLKVRQSKDGARAVTIRYDGRVLNVGGTRFPFELGTKETTLQLHIFLDKSVMEVFVNGGREAVTRVIYPGEHDLGIEVFATGGRAQVKSIDVWQMKPIW